MLISTLTQQFTPNPTRNDSASSTLLVREDASERESIFGETKNLKSVNKFNSTRHYLPEPGHGGEVSPTATRDGSVAGESAVVNVWATDVIVIPSPCLATSPTPHSS